MRLFIDDFDWMRIKNLIVFVGIGLLYDYIFGSKFNLLIFDIN